MKKRKFDTAALVATVVAGAAGALLLGANEQITLQSPGQISIWMGLFFLGLFLLGFAALQLCMHFGKFRVHRSRHWIAAAACAAVLIFAIGAGAQYLYMYSRDEITHTTVIQKKVDLVLLLDASGSMESYGYEGPRNDAAMQFVDSLSEDVQLQTAAFAGADWPMECTELMKMDASGKNTAKMFISQIDCTGGTNFDGALSLGLYTLTQHSALRDDSAKAVILMTDGDTGILTDSNFQAYRDAGIRLYTIRISNWQPSATMQTLIDFAASTGGFDTQITPDQNGSIDAAGMLDAFRKVFEATTQTDVEVITDFTDNLLIRTDHVDFGHHLLRTIALLAISILFGIGYFGRIEPGFLIINAADGLLLSLITAMIGSEPPLAVAAVIAAVILVPAYVCYDIPGGDEILV